jgi:hypothetical protein
MTQARYNIDQDLSEAKTLADNLIPYVYGSEMYGTVGGMFGSGSAPRLTIGALLQRLHRLHALEDQLSDSQKQTLSQIDEKNAAAYKEWTIHYNDKLAQEGISRLKVIEKFFEECDDNPRNCAANYPAEANRRTIVEEILKTLQAHNASNSDLTNKARQIDSKLRRYAPPSDQFLLASALQPAYPRAAYWWLYALPPRDA